MALGVGLLTLIRLIFAAVIPLTEDEAYYRLWASHLQFGYYDHPPMVAWGLALGRSILGDTALGARLVPVVGAAVSTLLTYDIARLAGLSDRTATRAALWYVAAPLVGFGAILILPDAGTTLFWTLTLWAILKAERSGRGAWWLLAGAAAGCAVLSKYSALFIAPGVLVWLVRSAAGRRKLAGPWPWAACLIAGGLFMTNVVWNAGEHWVTFAKQFGRVTPHGFIPWGPILFLVVLAALSNPLTAPFVARGVWARLGSTSMKGSLSEQDRGLDLVLVNGAPFLAYLCLHSLHASVEAHWPAPLYPSLAILAAVGSEQAAGPIRRRLIFLAAPVGLMLSTLALLHLALPQTDGLVRRDPSHPLRGWAPFAQRLEALRLARGAGWIGTESYGAYAQLALQPAIKASLLQLTERRRYLFAPPPPAAGLAGPGLVVDLSRRMSLSALKDCFAETTPVAVLPRGDAIRGDIYTVVEVSGPKRNLISPGCRSFHNGKVDD